MNYPLVAIIILAVTVVILIIKLVLLRRGYKELTQNIRDQVDGETSIPITLTTSDKCAREAAVTINDELKRLKDERLRFESGNRKIQDTVTNISHDLRTPLTAIHAYLDLLEEENDEEVRAEYLRRIKNRADVLTDLTGELFEYSKNTNGDYISSSSTDVTDLKRLTEECFISFYAAFTGKGIEPEIILPDAPVKILCDKRSADRILENIIGNALKYADGGFKAEIRSDGTAIFSNPAPNLTAVQTAKLFDRFYTVSDGTDSTGLGFAIARELTLRVGGKIEADLKDGLLVITVKFKEAT